jgi:Family of unknown function (DUF6350)
MTVSSPRPLRARGSGDTPDGEPPADRGPQQPLAVTGAIAACAAAGAGLAALTLLAGIGWIAAPHASVGSGLSGVVRTAIQLWLVGHHVSFELRGTGRVGLLPLGLVLLPGALLWRSGRWVVRTGQVERLRHVGYAALALALPYGLLAGALAVASRTALSAPSPAQAAGAGFLLALVAGGLGGARALAPWGRLIALLPDRLRCVVVGAAGALGVLAATGALLAGISLLDHANGFRLTSDELSPGPVGSALLLLAGLVYLPNAVVWAMAYVIGPGFAFGAGTIVAPAGSVVGPLPLFPMLAGLPTAPPGPHTGEPGPVSLALLAIPYLAGVFGGLLTVRTAPSPTIEAAPLWGLAAGAAAGCVTGALAVFSGGPLGTGRLAAIGPSGWQVALVATLEIGIAAAITAGIANWLLIRRRRARGGAVSGEAPQPATEPAGHRIYVNPWADDENREQPPDRPPDAATPWPVPLEPPA